MNGASLLATSQTAERVADLVRNAIGAATPLRIRGAGNWVGAGAPVAASQNVVLAGDNEIVEYVPGDLTMTVQAGTSLARIEEAARENNQWLPLDPYGTKEGTIGATIATASYGPLAQMFGTPRDQVLGVEFVTGAADIVRGGGRVTKNVAGFDLTRLICGSWGTLGAITEATLRLRAIPDVDVTLVVPVAGGANGLQELLTTVNDAAIAPAAFELLDERMCASVDLPMRGALLVRFCGNEPGVRVQRQRLARGVEAPQGIWEHLRAADREGEMVLRLSARPSQLLHVWRYASLLAAILEGTRFQASVGRGVLRMHVPPQWKSQLAAALAERGVHGGLVFESLPPELWRQLVAPLVVNPALNRRVRETFDPHGILNRGIFGEVAA